MNKKGKENEVYAVIDIGSNEVRFRVAQSGKSHLKYLESLSYPIALGRDTFDTGKISFEKTEKTCEIIKNFLQVASEYNVTQIKAIASSAIREATNREYILDQIKIKTSLDVEVIDDAEEKIWLYKLMKYLTDPKLTNSAMMIFIGSGSIGISVMENDIIRYAQNIKLGSMRISEIFNEVHETSDEFYLVVEEYFNSFLDLFEKNLPGNIKHFIAAGNEISAIGELCEAKTENFLLYISKEKLNNLYNKMKFMTVDRIALDYELPEDKAEVIIPALCIYNNLLNLTKAEQIVAPVIFLSDAVIFSMVYPEEYTAISKEFNKHTIFSARKLSERYLVPHGHIDRVVNFAVKIFDKMKKIHGMGSKEKLLLQMAAILHDVGKFINVQDHYYHSYNIIKGLDLVGLNNREKEIVASMSLYHSRITPSSQQGSYSSLAPEDRVLVSKLTAILRLADSLDRSHSEKFENIDVKISDENLIITIQTDKNTDLEQWSFDEKGRFFTEVFGIKAILRKKKVQ